LTKDYSVTSDWFTANKENVGIENKLAIILNAYNFIEKRYDDNMGIVIFGTFAYTASPLTYDLESLNYLLSLTNVGIAGESTAIGDAITQSLRTIEHAKNVNNVKTLSNAIILLTDGYHNAGGNSPKMAIKKAKSLGVKIYTIGIGSKSDYDVALLKRIAKETQGKTFQASSSDALSKIYKEIQSLEPSPLRSENYLGQISLFGYILFFAFTLLLLWVLLDIKAKK